MIVSQKQQDFDYDAAGRLTTETADAAGNNALRRTEYAYGWLDKVMNVTENGKITASFDYGIDGQIANRTDATGKSENFTWDGLALIKRDSTNFVNESAVTGGNPIMAFGKDSSKVLFEDMLGSSVGSVENGKFNAINRSAFGESNTDSELNFFTGKPQVSGLGYSFLFRNYRSEQGKWQTADPMGFPDGWNNLAYVNNNVTHQCDALGLSDLPSFTFSANASFSTSSSSSGVSISLSSLSYTPPAISYPDTGYADGWWRYAYMNYKVSFSGTRDNSPDGYCLFTYTYTYQNGSWQLTAQYGTNGLSLALNNSTEISITANWEVQMIIFIGYNKNDPLLGQYYDAKQSGTETVSYKKPE